MKLTYLILLAAVILWLAYRLYGRWAARGFGVHEPMTCPSHSKQDGVDYIPTPPMVVLGHHFASIAGAGPIVGPIIAITFGWIPAVLWILIGGIFFGAVHDLGSLVASAKHEGKSIGHIIKQYVGLEGKRLFLLFALFTLILVIAVFADIIAKTFINNPEVSTSSLLFILLAIVFGRVQKWTGQYGLPFVLLSIVGVSLTYLAVPAGIFMPISLSYHWWVLILLAYAFVSSIVPVHLLLLPRDYLNSFLLYGLMIAAIVGIFISNPDIVMDNQMEWKSESMGYLFPVLFVTIACGAISGFHSLVASGTTSKQLDQLRHAKPIGFGGMLIESFLAILAVGTVVIMGKADYASRLAVESPVPLFADGLGSMIMSLGLEKQAAVSFVALTVSAFAITTLDTCTRLARFCLEELLMEKQEQKGWKQIATNRYLSTTMVVLLSVLLLSSGGFAILWPLFGSANQLLAALSLLAITSWLINKGIKSLFVMIPMFFMFAVTLTSLLFFAWQHLLEGNYLLFLLAFVLILLSLVLLKMTYKRLKSTI